jgi:Ca2+-binding EF-hand superfamily protein
MDKEKTGLISSSDLWGVIQNLHLEGQISKEQVNTIIKEVGAYGSGKIHYSEFIAATMDAKNLLTDQRVHELFYRL